MVHPLALLFLGFVIGMLTGFLGVGGGFLLTPALNVFGFPMVSAIGTSFSVMAGNSFLGALRHQRLGNADFKLGTTLGVFGVLGVELGKRLVMYLEKFGLVGTYVRVVYIFLLMMIALFILRGSYSSLKKRKNRVSSDGEDPEEKHGTLARRIHQIKIPPPISLPPSGADSVSLWIIVATGLVLGFFSGFLGIGGGFVGLPLIIYVIGLPTHLAVGTSLISVFMMSAYGMIAYALPGKVEWFSAMIVLAGSIVGVQTGVYATRYVSGGRIRITFACLLLMVSISIFLKQITLVTASTYVLMGAACSIALAIAIFIVQGRFLHAGS